jgi:GMP synthase (glutamine-hydrolysing)
MVSRAAFQGALLDTIWKEAPQKFTAFHCHGDVFNVPDGAVSLASSELTPCEAFRYGTNAYGLLFHLEVTEGIINDMVRAFDDELARVRIDARRITKEARNNLPAS